MLHVKHLLQRKLCVTKLRASSAQLASSTSSFVLVNIMYMVGTNHNKSKSGRTIYVFFSLGSLFQIFLQKPKD